MLSACFTEGAFPPRSTSQTGRLLSHPTARRPADLHVLELQLGLSWGCLCGGNWCPVPAHCSSFPPPAAGEAMVALLAVSAGHHPTPLVLQLSGKRRDGAEDRRRARMHRKLVSGSLCFPPFRWVPGKFSVPCSFSIEEPCGKVPPQLGTAGGARLPTLLQIASNSLKQIRNPCIRPSH